MTRYVSKVENGLRKQQLMHSRRHATALVPAREHNRRVGVNRFSVAGACIRYEVAMQVTCPRHTSTPADPQARSPLQAGLHWQPAHAHCLVY
jgi:hypothetical protein